MTNLKDKKIAVILGGYSKERDVSLRTGEAIYQSLKRLGYDVIKFDPKLQSIDELSSQNIDVAFIALHGRYGEDGCIQGQLELMQIPYTSSGVLCSSLCYDKIRTKYYLQNLDIITPKFWVYWKGQNLADFLQTPDFKTPLIVKPNREGSSIGLTVIRNLEDLEAAINKACQHCEEVLVEEYIEGKEVTVGVLNGKALPTCEIVPKSGLYDYESKYTPGKTEYFVPARIPKEVEERLKKISEDIVRYLGCRGAPRVDFMLDKNESCYFLEVNTIPGMTETSLLPKAAKGMGIDFDRLCEEILKSARLDD